MKTRLATLRDQLAEGLIERETPLRLALLAALAGEHLLLVGPPGTAKSELARRLRYAFRDAPLFERLLTRFTVPEELFGPLSIKELEADRYHRQTEGYLPTAAFAFLDEIFKANSAILNALLTLLNEREFDNGTERVQTPLICAIGASNELPEGEELSALYDRFLLRCHVGPVSAEGFDTLLDLRGTRPPEPPLALRLSRASLDAFRTEARMVVLPADVKALLKALRTFLEEQRIPVSDRRWRKIVYLLQVSAWSHGRTEASVWDGWLLQHCTWERPEQREAIFNWYQARLGTVSPAEPERFSKLVGALEKQLETEKQSRSQARNEKGQPLFVDGDETVTKPEGKRRKRGSDKEPLFLAPPDRQKDRTQGGKGMTREEVEDHFNRHYGYGRAESYIADKNNYFIEACQFPPLMEPTRYSAAHIQGRVRQLQELAEEFAQYRAGLDAQVQSVTTVVEEHLWIAPGFSRPARSSLEQRQAHAGILSARLEKLRDGFKALPQDAT
ncbi:AAA family ATPase [Corallococcus exiguus]|uniref:AAA family ATPase n=1 Tax=Corallococcus exiguus TaxID=83462 RepID=UPI001471920F|nr:AAA family ATPase [Corallococcus exiguus]NNC19361.1 AAA domain-containing protein [Corallococcus exiguus]NRD53482.1 AAA family ATPase [Corallococcus exiguus]NRD63976.1 AAA family ATPase [Corallococcus exiguus]